MEIIFLVRLITITNAGGLRPPLRSFLFFRPCRLITRREPPPFRLLSPSSFSSRQISHPPVRVLSHQVGFSLTSPLPPPTLLLVSCIFFSVATGRRPRLITVSPTAPDAHIAGIRGQDSETLPRIHFIRRREALVSSPGWGYGTEVHDFRTVFSSSGTVIMMTHDA